MERGLIRGLCFTWSPRKVERQTGRHRGDRREGDRETETDHARPRDAPMQRREKRLRHRQRRERQLTVKESTIRFHNRNIYSKLGVNSLKQLLRYAALMQQDQERGENA